MAWSNLASARD
ncbi:unnamed protein product, partial [Didymodactylos carnosus]